MKKILSLLGMILILSTLLLTFASCGADYYVPADNEELAENQATSNNNQSKTEKEKSSIYASAMSSLRARDWAAAYNYFLQIPDYEDVPEYLAGFSYQANTVVIRDVTDDLSGEGTMIYNHSTSITDYGYFSYEKLIDYTDPSKLVTTNTTSQKIKVPAPTASNPAATADEKYGRPESIQYAKHTYFGKTVQGYKVEFVYEGTAENPSSMVKTEKIIGLQTLNVNKNYTYNTDKSIAQINLEWTKNAIKYNYEFQYTYNGKNLTQITFVDRSQNGDPTPRVYASYAYNSKGQLTSITYPGGIVDPIQDLSVWTGNLNTWNAPVWNEENVCAITYTYNAKGQLATETLNYTNSDINDTVTVYEAYNENGVVTQKTVTMNFSVTVGETTEIQAKTYRYTYTQIKLYYDPLS